MSWDRNALRRDMAEEASDLLGSGYVPEYYRNAASGFVMIAEAYLAEQEKELTAPPSEPAWAATHHSKIDGSEVRFIRNVEPSWMIVENEDGEHFGVHKAEWEKIT